MHLASLRTFYDWEYNIAMNNHLDTGISAGGPAALTVLSGEDGGDRVWKSSGHAIYFNAIYFIFLLFLAAPSSS